MLWPLLSMMQPAYTVWRFQFWLSVSLRGTWLLWKCCTLVSSSGGWMPGLSLNPEGSGWGIFLWSQLCSGYPFHPYMCLPTIHSHPVMALPSMPTMPTWLTVLHMDTGWAGDRRPSVQLSQQQRSSEKASVFLSNIFLCELRCWPLIYL